MGKGTDEHIVVMFWIPEGHWPLIFQGLKTKGLWS